jgi:hypothetical protein
MPCFPYSEKLGWLWPSLCCVKMAQRQVSLKPGKSLDSQPASGVAESRLA